MNYLSVCSGIEAATVAWDSLGFNSIGYSEIDKFCCELLKQKYPQTLNYGDINEHSKWEISKPIDILVGGTPCQSFSIAGLRKGLEDPRGGIMLKFLEIVRDRKPRWVVWENVPGVLSSNRGRDFGTFLGSLGNLGYGFAYRILDAQWFGLAQRRKRVFVIGCIGDWESPAKVLFKSESLCGNNSESRKKGQKITGNIAPSLTASNDPSRSPQSSEITQQVNAVLNAQMTYWRAGDQANSELLVNQAGTLNCNKGQQGGVLFQPTNMGLENQNKNLIYHAPITGTLAASDGPKGVSDQYAHEGKLTVWQSVENQTTIAIGIDCYNAAITGDIAVPLTNRADGTGTGPSILQQIDNRGIAYSFDSLSSNSMKSSNPNSGCRKTELSKTIDTTIPEPSKNQGGLAIIQQMAVRRLTPIECERLQGFPDNYTAIPWRKKLANQCPDGLRYKALGNSMAVPVVKWIGERIKMFDCPSK